jgi:hypothetical protein
MNKVIKYLLNTPKRGWVIIFGYHLHKSFWGCLLILAGVVILFLSLQKLSFIFFTAGIILIILSIAGHIHTKNRPYFKLWDKYKK